MTTLSRIGGGIDQVPGAVAWYVADLAEFRGRQELFTRQSPQRLKALRESAIIESAIASNRIEGVNIAQDRVRPVLVAAAALRDRDEEEVRGYRDALRLIHDQHAELPMNDETILRLHKLCRGDIWDAGQYKDKDVDIIERYADGTSRVRFRSVPAAETPASMAALCATWQEVTRQPGPRLLVALAAFNLDFLCIHPFRDGNGRVSRLLLLLGLYHLGFEVGRYISLERLVEENKERYYETLQLASQKWHEGEEDPWTYVAYLLSTLKLAYRQFEQRLEMMAEPRGAKTTAVEEFIGKQTSEFTIADIEHTCPGVSRDMIRVVLQQLRKDGVVECLSRGGAGAPWRRIGARGGATR